MKLSLFTIILWLFALTANSQQLQLLDRFNGNKIINDSTIIVFSSDFTVPDLTQYFTMKNNTDQTLAVFLRKTVNFYADSTSDYYCFGIRCWPGDDSTNIADSIPPGAEDYTFASHVTHIRRFDLPQPALPQGISSVTYTVYDKTTFPEPVEASVTVIYHLGAVGIDEEAWKENNPSGESVKVYPNPGKDWITVKVPENGSGINQLFVFNNTSSLMSNIKVDYCDNKIRIDVSNLKQGIYFGRIISEKGPHTGFSFQVVE